MERVGVEFVTQGKSAYLDDFADANKAIGGFADNADTAGGKIAGFAARTGDSLQTLGNVAVTAFAGAGVAAGGFLVASANVAGDYEATLNKFSSVTGSALAASGKSVEDFSALFLKMGADTQFSAGEAAQAAVELAKGGLDPATIAGGALAATLGLAAAGELELSKAAGITAKQLGVWGDTGVKATEVADLLAQAANASTVDVEGLALGLANAGGVAKIAGLSFQETVTTMAMLAPGFSSAADAGTSFKTFLSSLQPKSDSAALAMRDLGLITVDYKRMAGDLGVVLTEGMGMDAARLAAMRMLEAQTGAKMGTKAFEKAWLEMEGAFESNAFYDAAGNFIGMEKAADSLKNATKDLTQEQRVQTLGTIFGSDAIRAAAIIAEKGGEGFKQMGADMAGAGSAAAQATERNKGLNFAIETMKGSLETLQIVIGTAVLPIITEFIGGITEGINVVMNIAQQLGKATSAFDGFLFILVELGMPLNDAQGLALGLGDAFDVASKAIQPIIGFIGDHLEPILISLAGVIGGAVLLAIGGLIASFVAAALPIVALVAVGALLYEGWTSNFLGIQEIVATAFGIVRGVVETVVPLITGFIERHGEDIVAFFTGAWDAITEVVSGALAIASGVVSAVLLVIAGFISKHGDEIMAFFADAWEDIQTIIGTAMELVSIVIARGLEFFNTIILPALRAIIGFFTEHKDELIALLKGAWDVISGVVSGAIDLVKGVLATALALLKGDWEGAWKAIKETVDNIWEDIKKAVSGAIAIVETTVGGLRKVIEGALSGAGEWLVSSGRAVVDGLMRGIEAAWDGLVGWFKGKLSELTDLLPFSEPKDHSSPLYGLGKSGQSIVAMLQAGIDSAPALTIGGLDTKALSDLGGSFSGLGGSFGGKLKSEKLEPTIARLKEIDSLMAAKRELRDKLFREYDPEVGGWEKQVELSKELRDLTAERTQALQDQARIQQELNALETQQKRLSFLQEQMKLLDVIKANNLDAGSVLGGVTLGAGASTEGLVLAMTRAIEAIGTQVNTRIAPPGMPNTSMVNNATSSATTNWTYAPSYASAPPAPAENMALMQALAR